MIRDEPGEQEPIPGNANGAVSNARTVLGLSKQVGEMSGVELNGLARAAVGTLQNNRPSSAIVGHADRNHPFLGPDYSRASTR